MKPAFAVLAVLAFSAAAGAAQVYKWTDADGQVHYSQTPPPNAAYGKLRTAETPAPKAAASPGSQAADEAKFLQDAEAADKAAAESKQKSQAAKSERDAKCAEARERATTLDTYPPRRLATANPDGSWNRMDEKDYDQRVATAKHDVETLCPK